MIAWDDVWGHGSELGALPMSVRALAMFTIMLVLVRIGGVRLFSHRSSFDNVVAIVLGAVAARGIVGASDFGATVAASAVLVVLHRIVGWITVRSERLDVLIKGRRVPLYRDGRIETANLQKVTISESDMLESVRLEMQQRSLDGVEEAALERNGRISFVARRPS